jgi:hypothetical protein
MSKPDAVHCARHADIRENDFHVIPRVKGLNRFIGRGRLDGLEAGPLGELREIEAQEDFVFDDEQGGFHGCRWRPDGACKRLQPPSRCVWQKLFLTAP